jgi:NADH dehydrogenase
MCLRLEEMTSVGSWKELVREFDVILNCVGILRPQRSASYEQIHHLAPQAISAACNDLKTRFVHVSAIGLKRTDRSGFLTTKLRGENAIRASSSNWIITRPSLLDGEGGYGAAWLRGVSRLPVFATPADATGRIAALTATDLGEALARLCLAPSEDLHLNKSRIFELGGSRSYKFETYIRGLRLRHSQTRALSIPIPGIIARIGAHICDLLHITPFSFGHWELLRKDNVPTPNRLPELLGRAPTEVISDSARIFQ